MATRKHPTFKVAERDFILTMYRAGVAGAASWLPTEFDGMVKDLGERLEQLPEPAKPRAAKAKAKTAPTDGN